MTPDTDFHDFRNLSNEMYFVFAVPVVTILRSSVSDEDRFIS